MAMTMERIEEMQKKVLWILYAAMALKVIGDFVPVLNFASGVLLAVFFLLELFVLSPLGLAIMSVLVGVLFFVLPSLVGFMLALIVESVVLMAVAGLICVFCSGIILTFIGGWLASVQVVIVTAPMTIAAGVAGGTMALGAGIGLGTKVAIDAASQVTGNRWGRAAVMFLANVLVMVLVGWPVLSYTGAMNGVMALKPAVTLRQVHMHELNLGEKMYEWYFQEEESPFGSQYYDEIVRGTNNNIAQGKTNLVAGNDETLAVLFHDILYLRDVKRGKLFSSGAYHAKAGDAMLLDGETAFIFGRDKIYVCGPSGHYMWKDTRYVSEFEKLSWEEKCERLYGLLEKQNTEEEACFSCEEVGLVARAQKSGLLLNYNRNTHEAMFTRPGEKGRIHFFTQNTPGVRQEQGSFVPEESDMGLTFVKIGMEGILYLDGSQVKFMAEFDDWKTYSSFTHPDGKDFRTMNYGWVNGDYDQRYTAYLGSEEKLWLDVRNIGPNEVMPSDTVYDGSQLVGFAGPNIYVFIYPDDLLSRLTYIQDVRRAAEGKEDFSTSGFRADRISGEWRQWWRIPLDKEELLGSDE